MCFCFYVRAREAWSGEGKASYQRVAGLAGLFRHAFPDLQEERLQVEVSHTDEVVQSIGSVRGWGGSEETGGGHQPAA